MINSILTTLIIISLFLALSALVSCSHLPSIYHHAKKVADKPNSELIKGLNKNTDATNRLTDEISKK